VISAQQAFSVFAFAASSAPARDFPRSVAGTPVGLAIGWGNRALQLVATTTDGQVRRWSVLGLPETFRWEAVGHDARHTGSADAALPVREVPGLGVKDPVHRPPSPCGCGAGGPPGALLALLGLGALLRRASPRRREIC
jgi:MYXO-CTERM domain-containing protein